MSIKMLPVVKKQNNGSGLCMYLAELVFPFNSCISTCGIEIIAEVIFPLEFVA
jgi:hypothetical protein